MRALGIAATLFVVAACSREPSQETKGTTPITKEASPGVASAQPSASTSSAPAASAPKVVTAPDDVDAISFLRTKRLEAKSEGRTLVVYAGASWCPPCKQFREELRTGRLDGELAKVTLVVFDADKDGDRLKAAGYTFQYIPYVALPGPDGGPKDSAQATGKGADAWRALLGKLSTWQR